MGLTGRRTSYRASPNSKAVWTGTEILVYGGYFTGATDNGFRYNPGTNVWTAIPTINQPEARSEFAMELINNKLVVWGGLSYASNVLLNTGAMLDLSTNVWTTMSTTNAPSARFRFAEAANNTQNTMIIWGGQVSINLTNVAADGAIFNPAANTWTAMNNTGAPAGREYAGSVWSGSAMILFGGSDGSGNILNSGSRYDPAGNAWTAISTTGAPFRKSPGTIWTGSNMLISGGASSTGLGAPFAGDAYLYNPVSNTWSSAGSMKINKSGHKLIRAGNMILAFGGGTSIQNPVTGTYTYYGGYPEGSRYFLTAAPVTEWQILSLSDLYLYIKQ